MRYDFMILDVFTDKPFGGNQLAVLTDARGISAQAMQMIAREFDFPETTFVLPPSDPAFARRVRIFTPGGELPFAGHPTVGTACALAMVGHTQIGEALAGGLEQGGEVLEQLPCLGLDPALDQLARRRVLRHLSAEEDEVARADRLREGTHRRRQRVGFDGMNGHDCSLTWSPPNPRSRRPSRQAIVTLQ